MDGNFHTGHILYDPNAFNSDLLFSVTEIQLICPNSIPWLTTDVTQLPIHSWESNERIDKILQLIFFDLDQVQTISNDFKDILVFYRLFVFPSIDEAKGDHQIDQSGEASSPFESSSLVVKFSSESVLVYANWIVSASDSEVNNDKLGVSIELIFEQNPNIDWQKDNVFNRVFEKYEKNYMKAINLKSKVNQNGNEITIANGVAVLGDFYFSNRNYKPSSGKIYRELSEEYQPIGTKSL